MFGQRGKKEAKKNQAAAEDWQAKRDAYAKLLQTAQTFNGASASELMLLPGEAVFYKVTGASLIEDRKAQGHYQRGSRGVSVPLGSIGGRAVRYRVGASHGHYVQGASKPTAIDTGTVYITNKCVIFQGGRQTRECTFAKLLGFHHDDREGSTTFSVSNRQKPTTIHYGPQLSASFDFRLDLAIAHFKGTVPQFISQLRTELARIDTGRPAGPVAALVPAPVAQAGSSYEVMLAWMAGPGGQALKAVNAVVGTMTAALAKMRSDADAPRAREDLISPCDQLAAATATAMTAPSIPDATAQLSWMMMLSGFHKAATSYRTGMEADNAELIRSGQEQQQEATRYMAELTRRIDALRQAAR
jgi:hypothetical protein